MIFQCLSRWIAGYAGFLLREGYIAYCACPSEEMRMLVKCSQNMVP